MNSHEALLKDSSQRTSAVSLYKFSAGSSGWLARSLAKHDFSNCSVILQMGTYQFTSFGYAAESNIDLCFPVSFQPS